MNIKCKLCKKELHMTSAFGNDFHCSEQHYNCNVQFSQWNIDKQKWEISRRNYETYIIGSCAFSLDLVNNVTRVFENEGSKYWTFLYFEGREIKKFDKLLKMKEMKTLGNNPGLFYTI